MARMMKVLGRMFVRRAVAAADVTAIEAQPEMHPPTMHLEALFTSIRRERLNVTNLAEMCAVLGSHLNDSGCKVRD